MGQAQRRFEQLGRVRSLPPPLPRRSDIVPAGTAAAAESRKPRSTPPPPPLAAMRVSCPPRLSAPVPAPVHLALLPQWDDANAPLRPAPKHSNSLSYWIGSATISIAVGALVAASIMSMHPGDYAQILPRGQAATLAKLQSAPQAPVELHVIEAEQGLEIQADSARAAQPVLMAELTVTSEPSVHAAKPAKRAKLARRAQRTRNASALLTSSQPDPRDEAVVEAAPALEAQAEPSTTDTTATTEETPVVEASEPVAPEVIEPAATALPEKLTRDQVRSGLDAQRSQVLACAKGTYGRVLADVTISAPGRVSNAVIEGTFAGTNSGSCMARVLRGAKFPAFTGEDISVRYPFSF